MEFTCVGLDVNSVIPSKTVGDGVVGTIGADVPSIVGASDVPCDDTLDDGALVIVPLLSVELLSVTRVVPFIVPDRVGLFERTDATIDGLFVPSPATGVVTLGEGVSTTAGSPTSKSITAGPVGDSVALFETGGKVGGFAIVEANVGQGVVKSISDGVLIGLTGCGIGVSIMVGMDVTTVETGGPVGEGVITPADEGGGVTTTSDSGAGTSDVE